MIQENEIIRLLLGIGVLIFIFSNHVRLKRLPSSNILISAFYVLLTGWVLTILEGFFWENLFNLIQHMCYTVSLLLIAIWCWKVFAEKEESRQ